MPVPAQYQEEYNRYLAYYNAQAPSTQALMHHPDSINWEANAAATQDWTNRGFPQGTLPANPTPYPTGPTPQPQPNPTTPVQPPAPPPNPTGNPPNPTGGAPAPTDPNAAQALHTWQSSSVSPELQKLFSDLLGTVRGRAEQLFGPNAPQLPGVTPGANADQLSGQDFYRNLAANFSSFMNPALQQQKTFFSNAQNPLANPAVTAMMDANAKAVNQAASDPGGIWSQIRQGANEAGQYGSSRQGIAEGVAAGRVADTLAKTNADILNNAYNTGQNAALGALGQTGALASTQAMPGNLLSAVGQQNYDIAQNKNVDARNAFLFGQQGIDKALAQLASTFQLGLPTGTASHTAVDYPDFYVDNQTGGGSGNSNAGGLLAFLSMLSAFR